MRPAYRSYELPNEIEVQEVLKAIKKPGIVNRYLLMYAINQVYPALQDEIYLSLVYGLSYEAIERQMKENIPLDKKSFYGHRRKAVSIYAFMLNEITYPQKKET